MSHGHVCLLSSKFAKYAHETGNFKDGLDEVN